MFIYNRKPPYFDATHKSKIHHELFISVMFIENRWISTTKYIAHSSIRRDKSDFDSYIKEIHKQYDSSDKIWN